MAAPAPDSVPRTPGIREIRPDKTDTDFGRVEIDTSPPFGSVKEAVTHFGGSGSWVPLHRLRHAYNGVDIKKVEEQAAELEKDLIVKELETLDVLEELATTKRIVEELKRQLHKEALRTPDHLLHSDDQQILSPVTKEMNMENLRNIVSPCANSSPDLILMELKQAKLNLGKTMNDLGAIQSSVETLNMKLKEEKSQLEKTRKRLFAGVLSLEEELKDIRVQPAGTDGQEISIGPEKLTCIARDLPQQVGKFKRVAEAAKSEIARLIPEPKVNLKTYEMRWFAAKKMEEAARAAEALALCEIKALSGEYSSGYILPEPGKEDQSQSPVISRPSPRKIACNMVQLEGSDASKLSVLRKLEEATKEVKHSKEYLEKALSRVELASRKQFAAEEALRSWTPDHDHKVWASPKLNPVDLSNTGSDLNLRPVLKPTISMRDVLSRKQVQPEECVMGRQPERQKVALSQMLQELRDDLTFSAKGEKEGSDQRQFLAQRKKFGFIHISLPLTKQSKKKPEALNTR